MKFKISISVAQSPLILFCGIYFIFFIIIFSGCNNNTANTLNQNYFNSKEDYVFQLDSIIENTPKELRKNAASHFIDSIYNIDKCKISTDCRYIILVLEGIYTQAFKDYTRIYDFINSNIELLESGRLKDDFFLSELYFGRADAYLDNDLYQKAYDDFLKVKPYWEKDQEMRCKKGQFLHRLGMISYKQKDFIMSRRNFIESLHAIQDDCDSEYTIKLRKQEVLNNIGLTFLKTNENDSAIIFFQKALYFLDTIKSEMPYKETFLDYATSVCYKNFGIAFLQKDMIDSAEYYLNIAVELTKSFENRPEDLGSILLRLGQLYLSQNNLTKFEELNDLLRTQVALIDYYPFLVEYSKTMSEYYLSVNNQDSLLHYLEKYRQMLNKQHDIDIDMLSNDFELYSQIYENKELANLLALNTKVYKQYTTALVASIVFVVIIILLLSFNYINLQKQSKETQRINQNLSKSNFKLEESNAQKNRILSIAAHDLRNPVGAIKGFAELYKIEDNSDERSNYLNLIIQSSENSLSLINEILMMSSVDHSNDVVKELDKKHSNIKLIVQDIVKIFEFKAQDKNQQIIITDLLGDEKVMVDENLLKRAIGNLIGNALKFSGNNKRIEIKLEKTDNSITIAVKDEGIGIPEYLLKDLFQSFSNSKRTGTDGEQAFGLGLYITKAIVEAHNGTIDVHSVINQGTTFTISIPLV